MNRHEARIYAINILFDIDINQLNPSEMINNWQSIASFTHDSQADFWQEENNEMPILDSDDWEKDTFLNSLVDETLKNLITIDQILMKSLLNWTIDRLSYVDRAIVRLAVCEIYYLNTPIEVAINEALEITKEFSDLDDNRQVKFTNRLLDTAVEVINNERKQL